MDLTRLRRFALAKPAYPRSLLVGAAIGATAVSLFFSAATPPGKQIGDAPALDLVVEAIPYRSALPDDGGVSLDAAGRRSDLEFDRRAGFLPARALHACGAKAFETHIGTDGYEDATIPLDENAISVSQCLSDERRVRVYIGEHRR